MSEERGIKETKELFVAIDKLTLLFIKKFKDGLDFSDGFAIAKALVKDDDFKEAVKGLQKLPAEMKDLDFAEAMELGKIFLDGIPNGQEIDIQIVMD